MTTKRYQHGSLRKVRRKSGLAAWEFLWWETGTDGKARRKHVVLGNEHELKTKADAQREAEVIRARINRDRCEPTTKTLGLVARHYVAHELNDENQRLSYATRDIYGIYISRWVLPRWETTRLEKIRGVDVEQWLGQIKLSDGSKTKIRNVMSALYSHAIRHDWIRHNPISSVRQSAKRLKTPDVLTPEDLGKLVDALEERERMLVVLDFSTGLRISELLALKWEDFDLENLQLQVRRSIYHQQINERCKTDSSRRAVPLSAEVVVYLNEWRNQTPYNCPEDWVFASPTMSGQQPYWPERLRRKMQAAACSVGIAKRVGWHTFRHSLSTLLKASGVDVKVIQELLRHSSSRITLDVYTQAPSLAKREAQDRLVGLVLNGNKRPNGTIGTIVHPA